MMIGPRSALFTPFPALGIIIIDEEHEASYKSETVPRYHARETAIQRAKMTDAVVVLGSATPSLESYYKAENDEYCLLELKHRVQKRPMPLCEIIDLREELRRGNRSILSDRLSELMEDRLKRENRRCFYQPARYGRLCLLQSLRSCDKMSALRCFTEPAWKRRGDTSGLPLLRIYDDTARFVSGLWL